MNPYDTYNYTPIESVVDVTDNSIKWYWIYGYNGYELSNTGLVRSMKHYRKYPFGMLIRPDKHGYYSLSDNDNIRQKVTMQDIVLAVNNNPYKNTCGYPRKTTTVDICSRNNKLFVKKPPRDPQLDKEWVPNWIKS